MYCRNCGQKLPDGARFCPICGTDVPDLETLMAAMQTGRAQHTQVSDPQETAERGSVPHTSSELPADQEKNLYTASPDESTRRFYIPDTRLQNSGTRTAGMSDPEEPDVGSGLSWDHYTDSGTPENRTLSESGQTPPLQEAISDSDETVILPEEFLQQYGQASVYNADMPGGRKKQAADQPLSSARAYIPEDTLEPQDDNDPADDRSRLPGGARIAILAAAVLILIVLSAFITVKLLDSGTEDELTVSQEAQSAYNAGRYEEAVSILEDWLDQADSATSAIYRLLARSYEALGDLDTAADVYAEGYSATGQQTLADSAIELWLTLAETSSSPSTYYSLVLALDPDNETALNAAAGTSVSAEIPEETESEDAALDSTESDSSETETADSLSDSEQAQAFYDAGDYNGAEVLLYTMRRSGSMTADDYALYGLVLQAQDREDSAVTMYFEGFTQTGDSALLASGTALALELAEASIEKGDYEVAQIWYETILEYDSSNADAAAGLAAVETLLNPADPVYETQYLAVTGSYTWEEARQEAEARGGQLAVITDLETWNAIVEVLNDTLLTAVWTGGSTDTPGDWDNAVWTDGSSVSWTKWYTGQPDGESSYLSLILQDGSWYYSAAWTDLGDTAEVTGFIMEIETEIAE